ncbi:MAG: hypothetical protein ICV68_06790 [Pyrinomonadaceae bacterium]|nr:hypothetical protein [Pyrinomonadaceae bacterium]
MRKSSRVLRFAIAALLILGAAICAAAQSGNSGKRNDRQQQPASQDANKQDGREQSPASKGAAKQTARETVVGPPSSSSNTQAAGVQYSYEFTQPQFYIRRIFIQHDEQGRGQITFERKDEDVAIVDPIELSPAALTRVKALWDALHFLDSNTNYQTERQMSHLGTMRLGMKQGERERIAEFNWTNDPSANTLVNEYRRAADQAIFIFNINVARENQPLGAPKLMDELEKLYKRNSLSDPQQLIPLLLELTTDERIPLIARNHAGRLLKQIQKQAQSANGGGK